MANLCQSFMTSTDLFRPRVVTGRYATRGYPICHAWLHTIPRVDIRYASRGTTRDVYVLRHEKTWSTQTRNGILLQFYRVATRIHACKNEVVIEQYRSYLVPTYMYSLLSVLCCL